jgi:hypothetical protein
MASSMSAEALLLILVKLRLRPVRRALRARAVERHRPVVLARGRQWRRAGACRDARTLRRDFCAARLPRRPLAAELWHGRSHVADLRREARRSRRVVSEPRCVAAESCPAGPSERDRAKARRMRQGAGWRKDRHRRPGYAASPASRRDRRNLGARPSCGAGTLVPAGGDAPDLPRAHRRRRQRGLVAAPATSAARSAKRSSRNTSFTIHEVVLIRTGAIPKTASGKIRRSLTRELWLKGELEIWDGAATSPTAGSSPDDGAAARADSAHVAT